jgi:hypothetical protein
LLPADSSATLWALVGSLGLLLAGLRTLLVFLADDPLLEWTLAESKAQIFFLAIGTAALLFLGLFPQWVVPLFAKLPAVFQQLAP